MTAYDLGPVHAIHPLRGGRMALTWRVSAEAGEFVLRRAEADVPGRMALALRQRFVQQLAEHLPEVPRLVANVRGETITEVEGERYELLTFIEGETRDEAAGPGEMGLETIVAAGRLLGRYHQAAALAGIRPPERVEPGEELAARWERLRSRIEGRAEGSAGDEKAERGRRRYLAQAGKPAPLAELGGAAAERVAQWVRELQTFWAGTTNDERPTTNDPPSVLVVRRSSLVGAQPAIPWLWAHGDFTPYNLVYRGGLPVGLLDFGAVQWAPAAYDVAVALLAFAGPEGAGVSAVEPGDARDPRSLFLAAYTAERPLSDAEYAALPMLVLHRRVIAVLWIAEECLAGREELRPQLSVYLGTSTER